MSDDQSHDDHLGTGPTGTPGATAEPVPEAAPEAAPEPGPEHSPPPAAGPEVPDGTDQGPAAPPAGVPAAPVATPPGWYLDPAGHHRWWDGSAWGPYSPTASRTPEQDGQGWACLAWLSYFVLPVVVPIALYLTEGKKNRFVRWHAAEALNTQLTLLLVFLGGWLAFVLSALGSAALGDDAAPAVGGVFLLLVLLVFASNFTAMFASLYGAYQAYEGRWWRFPLAIPFLRAHRREREAELAGTAATP